MEHKYRQLYGEAVSTGIGKGVDLYTRWRSEGDRILDTAAAMYKAFCHAFHESIYRLDHPGSLTASLTIGDLRQVFVKQLSPQRIRPMIRKCIDRAKVELEGEPINVTLLSGGSSNIRWLRVLLQSTFEQDLMGAPLISLYDYQEVVAKGLAIGCARRFYGRNKDFRQVT